MKNSRALFSAFILLTFVTGSASAASMSYFLDQSNDLPDGANYAMVTIADSVAHAGDIEFTVAVNVGEFPTPLSNFGMQSFYFNYDNSLSIDSLCIKDLNPSDWDINDNKTAGGGFGRFEFEFKGVGSNRTELLTFRITGVAGDTIDSYAIAADMLKKGSTEYFAAHIAGYDDSVSENSSGWYGGSTAVPVPAAVWFLGSGLGMLGWMRRRKVTV